MVEERKAETAVTAAPVRQMQALVLPQIYFNGFELATSLSDMGLYLLVDGQPSARVNFSFTMAKTLAQNLSKAVLEFEKQTNHNLMTMDEIFSAMQAKAS
jgi:threonine aldolase